MKDNLAILGKSALVGGLFGVLGAALAVLFAFTPMYANGSFTVILVLITMAIIGVVLWLTGIQQKLEDWAGMGAMLTFGALASVISQMTYATGKAKRSAAKGAVTPLNVLYLKVILPALAIAIIIALITNFTGIFDTAPLPGSKVLAPYPPGGVEVINQGMPYGVPGPFLPQGEPVGVDPLVFLWAFLICGVISALSQLIVMLTSMGMPTFFLISIITGAILTPFGVMRAIVTVAGGGFQVMVFDAGEAMMSTFYQLLHAGDPLPFVSVLVMLILLALFGMAGGWIKLAREKKSSKLKD